MNDQRSGDDARPGPIADDPSVGREIPPTDDPSVGNVVGRGIAVGALTGAALSTAYVVVAVTLGGLQGVARGELRVIDAAAGLSASLWGTMLGSVLGAASGLVAGLVALPWRLADEVHGAQRAVTVVAVLAGAGAGRMSYGAVGYLAPIGPAGVSALVVGALAGAAAWRWTPPLLLDRR
jgi:hypothetical protein